jgi:GNAT superfamily N-acetyltransferase
MSTLREIRIENNIFAISDSPTDEEMARIQNAVENDKRTQTRGEYDQPGVEINLVLKDADGNVLGGVIASTIFRVMHLEVLWVAEAYRRLGYGSQLVLGAEQLGFKQGCNTSQTWTFSFQGPAFYPTIGYQPIGIYDGYPHGITEHVFMKRLSADAQTPIELDLPDARGLYLTTDVSEEDQKTLHAGLHNHVISHIGDEYKGISIKLIIKDQEGNLAGGLLGWTTLQNLIFEHIWIEEDFRRKGMGRKLMQEMEMIAEEQGCMASQAYCFSFQALGFLEKLGYKTLGVSDGYPHPVKEYYLIKKYI